MNIIGSSVATIVVTKWENAFDPELERIAFGIVPSTAERANS
jgi:Na+/H+-dicarboxylate symporter